MTRVWLVVCMVMFLGMQACSIYRYNRTADGCSISIYSARDVQAGDIKVDKNCAVTGSADALKADGKAIDAINALIGKIP